MVGSYIADQQSASLVGSWHLVTALSSAYVGKSTLTSSTTANTYTATYANELLASSVWSATNTGVWEAMTVGVSYDLTSSGWVLSPSTSTLVDNGDGSTISITPSGESALKVTVSSVSLAGEAISCSTLGVACTVPGNYPNGAVQYQYSYPTTMYFLGTKSNVSAAPITDASGTILTALPTIGTLFCDPNNWVLSPISPTPAAGASNYNAYTLPSGGCTSANITTAIAGTVLFTTLISTQATGNTTVPNVLRLSGMSGSYTGFNNPIYGLNAGNVWSGFMYPAGVSGVNSDKNKIAINAELVANGLTAIP